MASLLSSLTHYLSSLLLSSFILVLLLSAQSTLRVSAQEDTEEVTDVSGSTVTPEEENVKNPYDKSKPFDRTGLAMTPDNEWGSYFNLNQEEESRIFNIDIFGDMPLGTSECDSSGITFSRYYKSTKDPALRIYSYYCVTSDGYEHILANAETKKFLEFKDKLSAFGITDAGGYDPMFTIKDGEAKDVAVKLWTGVWNKDQLDERCVDPTADEVKEVEMKSENYLMYYRFQLMCEGGKREVKVEVFQDDFYSTYMEGRPTLCYMERVLLNQDYKPPPEPQQPL
ncbi:uncharacterized protein LOC142338712 [Convolutriloba macropyga]|uniref:uncharacterized protein LOC142338712 n=1 Tax=Convolutriloba macropyga TaxID=536237 RepID=UPI003F522B71